ncbi:hypothetical protein MLD38_038966 [Melastoma candidum]|uniref:Uncharacterized protein n=1 Tax=Melastoma candidum TaxID=119954 RepID=A0ACB9L1F8_9MYRT|nr:hypothetical protein MLD38_038966 [Melastoma candidum]
MDNSRSRQNDHLGVNKIGKNIRKSPIHQPTNSCSSSGSSLTNVSDGNNNSGNAPRQQPQPQVYNISKNDFRSIVQQLTGSPARDRDPLPRPPNNLPKSHSTRLQKIRPPPLTPMNRPHMPPQAAIPAAPPPVPYDNSGFVRSHPYGQPSPRNFQTISPGVLPFVGNTNESPISAYMRYLQAPLVEPTPNGDQRPPQPSQQPILPPSVGLLPGPHPSMLPSPRMNGPMPTPPFPNLPSPQMNGGPVPALLPSPTSQFLLPSPSSYLNLQSPRSPYPLLSPGFQFPSPLTSNFSFSSMTQPGILGPGPLPPPSPGFFPLSPSGFFAMPSPRWRSQ